MIQSRFRLIPQFVLKDEDGNDFSWKNLLGRYTVVYFYPKANTPGCTLEGLDFTKLIDEFNGNVVGISPDDCKAIASFKSKKGLKVKLLSDPDKAVAEQFGVVKDGKLIRSTFIVDPWGRIRKEWIKVNVNGHAEEVLQEYKRIIQEDQALNDNILLRRALRGVRPDPVEDEKIETLIKAAHLAPSCMNKQPWRFLVVRTKENLEKLHSTLSEGNYWMKHAPVMIIVYTDDELGCQLSDRRNYALFDTGTAVGLLLAQATQMGLIAHPVAGYDPIKVKELFEIKGVVITLIAVGYWGNIDMLNEKHLAAEFSERIRKPVEEIAKYI
ncbi:Peroxiredoxin [Fervidobacterium changbaicum]|uniref:Nitroreductase n=1 Tax=Fervidobacterium changbaicum TaxID=310769 RepID=A0ABX5QU80_9BACT|nr:redoxin domain-containing protein [Fervidobacterium changbaicum]QAV33934.1 nitroreductase [Fervidobacterium changbaicum]SDH56492.1 Peroxiredoxin [Fervidobacterium changbaicum]